MIRGLETLHPLDNNGADAMCGWEWGQAPRSGTTSYKHLNTSHPLLANIPKWERKKLCFCDTVSPDPTAQTPIMVPCRVKCDRIMDYNITVLNLRDPASPWPFHSLLPSLSLSVSLSLSPFFQQRSPPFNPTHIHLCLQLENLGLPFRCFEISQQKI